MDLSNLYYRRPRLLALTILLIAAAGIASLELLPRAEDPELSQRNAQIFTALPGADADRVETLVTDVIEDMLAEFEEIKTIDSTSRAGISTVGIELWDSVYDVQPIWTEIRDELGAIRPQLPASALEPDFVDFELSAYTLLVGLTWDLETPPERAILGRLAEDLADRLRSLPGTHDVALTGAPDEEVVVELDPDQLAARGLDALQVARTIASSDAKAAAGEVFGARNELQLQVAGEIETLDDLRDVVIDLDPSGEAFVRVGDVARVTKTEASPPSSAALVDTGEGGRFGVVVAARMETGRRVDQWAAKAKRVTEETIAALPRGVRGEILFDQSEYTRARLGDLVANFLMGAGLVMIVMFFTMGWRAALLVGSALPLTTLMVLQALRMLNVPLHQMSITGMIIALGLLIDNAIVVVDEVQHRLKSLKSEEADGSGKGRRARAVGDSVRHLAVPLLGSTLTTCFAFAPIALMPGGAGEFVGPIAISVILAILCSFFLALTVTPALTALLDRASPAGTSESMWARGVSFRRLDRAFGAGLGFLYRRPVLGISISLVFPIVGFFAALRLPEQFFPPADRDQFNVQLYLDPTASIDTTRQVAERAREIALEHPRVERVHLFLGESGPKYYYNLVETQRDAPYYAQALVQLDGPEDSMGVVRDVQEMLDRALPEAVVIAQQIEQGPPFDAPVEMHVFGPDLAVLREVGDQVRRILTDLPSVTHVRSTLTGGAPGLELKLGAEAARLAGTDNLGISDALQFGLVGAQGGSMIEGTEELPVRVRVSGAARGDAGRVETLEIPVGSHWTSLASLGTFELTPRAASIAHRDRERVYTVQGFLTAGTLPSRVLTDLEEALAERGFAPPDGYRLEVGGESAERDTAVGNLASSAALLMVLMAAALVLTFNSFRLAGVIGAVGVLSIGLALAAVAVYGAPFGFMTIVGAMGLIGIAINDSIVVLAALREDEGARRGDPDATVAVVRRATRHVVSTSLTTMAGFTPLILAGGGFWPPLAVAIAGGVAGATLIAVTLVPASHLVIARRDERRRGAPARAAAARAAAGGAAAGGAASTGVAAA